MSATYSLHCAATTSHPLTSTKAAALLLGPELYPIYIHWQIDIEDPEQAALYPSRLAWRRIIQAVRGEEVGGMPSAQTFKAFMNTRRVKKQLYMQDAEDYLTDEDGEDEEEKKEGSPDLLTTRLCKHSVHPGNPCTATDVCPVCLMNQCLASLKRIAHVWSVVGGPCKPCRSADTGVLLIDPEELIIYHAAKRLWNAEKGRWANLVNVYEQYAEGERLWEEDSRQGGFAIPASVSASSSCMEALELAMQTPFLVEGWSETFVPRKLTRQRSIGDESQGSSVAGDKETELPCSPPDSLETEPETVRYFDGTSDQTVESGNQTAHGVDRAGTISSSSNKSTVPLHSPFTCSESSIDALSPPQIPPSSPPQTPIQAHLPSPPIFGVSFPDDLLSPSSRRSVYYQRASPFYKRGNHTSPFGSTWVDTSFMSDSKYDRFGIGEDEDKELDRLMRARMKVSKKCAR